MEEKAIKLFLENYNNKGMCEGLDKCVKSFDKGFRKASKTISYYPWAIVERIFRLQGGKIEVVDWNYSVDFERTIQELDMGENSNGEVKETTVKEKALFIHLKGTWMGEELEEFYPIFDNQTSRVIKTPDAQQLNTSRQRGMVRLIARLSGIGLNIFEQQDQQFEGDNEEIVVQKVEETKEEKETKKAKTIKKAKPTLDIFEEEEKPVKKSKAKVEEVKEELVEDNDTSVNVADAFFGGMFDMGVEETQKNETPKIEEPKEEEFGEESEEKADLLLEVKGYIRTHRDLILNYRNQVGKETLSSLSYKELKDLLKLIKGQ